MLLLWAGFLVLVWVQPALLGQPRLYCGQRLNKALTLFCQDIQNSDSFDGGMQQKWIIDSPEQNKWSVGGASGGGVVASVVAQCCLRPCYINELLSFCSAQPGPP